MVDNSSKVVENQTTNCASKTKKKIFKSKNTNIFRIIVPTCFMIAIFVSMLYILYTIINTDLNLFVKKEKNSISFEIFNVKQMKTFIKESNEIDKKIVSDYILHKNRKSFPQLAKLIVDTILKMEDKYNIPYEYLLALIQIESSFNTDVISNKDCIGLTQINHEIWVGDDSNKYNLVKNNILETKEQLYYPTKNIEAGAFILSYYISKGIDKNKNNLIKYGVKRYHGVGKKSIKHYDKFENALGEFLIFKKIKKSKYKFLERKKDD